MGISASNKYEIEKEGYLSKMFDLVRNCSSNPVEDVVKLWDMILFNYLIGNTDSHIKNYSLLYNADFTEIRLAPAYDIVSSRAYKGTSVMAYYIGDEKTIDNIKLENIQQAAEEAKISEKIAMERYDYLESNIGRVLNDVSTMLFYEGYEDALKIANLIRVKR